MIVERMAGEYLIAGHGVLRKTGTMYHDLVVPNGIELVLFSLPGTCSSVGLGNAMVLRKKCRLKLDDIKTKKTIDNDYNPPVLSAGKFTPDYSIQKAPEINYAGKDIIMPTTSDLTFLSTLLRYVPIRAGMTTRCYVVCCGVFSDQSDADIDYIVHYDEEKRMFFW